MRYPNLTGCECCGALFVEVALCPYCGWETGMIGIDSDARDHTVSSGSYQEYRAATRKRAEA